MRWLDGILCHIPDGMETLLILYRLHIVVGRVMGLFALFCVLVGCKQKPEEWKPVASAPLKVAHAHNDYLHTRPLLDALDHRFTSVEADIHEGNGTLEVAHFWWNRDARRTLDDMYLKPLWKRYNDNKGSIYKTPSRFYLLIDIKTGALSTYKLLETKLAPYKKMLTLFTGSGIKWGAVTVIVSGNRPLDYMKQQKERLAGYDGRPDDLKTSYKASFMPMVSQKWSSLFSWNGEGEMPAKEWKQLQDYVADVHKKGALVRFWATPDAPGAARDALWSKLLLAGVDLINTDDLTGLQQFLLKRVRPSPRTEPPTERPTEQVTTPDQ